jgi:hypothetical protein
MVCVSEDIDFLQAKGAYVPGMPGHAATLDNCHMLFVVAGSK